MRALVLLAVPSLLACKAEPDFDERYEAAERHIEETARGIDAQLAAPASPAVDESPTPPSGNGTPGSAGSSAPDGP